MLHIDIDKLQSILDPSDLAFSAHITRGYAVLTRLLLTFDKAVFQSSETFWILQLLFMAATWMPRS